MNEGGSVEESTNANTALSMIPNADYCIPMLYQPLSAVEVAEIVDLRVAPSVRIGVRSVEKAGVVHSAPSPSGRSGTEMEPLGRPGPRLVRSVLLLDCNLQRAQSLHT